MIGWLDTYLPIVVCTTNLVSYWPGYALRTHVLEYVLALLGVMIVQWVWKLACGKSKKLVMTRLSLQQNQ